MAASGRSRKVVEATVAGLGGRGDAVLRLKDGEVVFAAGGAPGDRVRLRLPGRRAGVRRGRIEALIEPGSSRVEPFCPVADRCGGCSWQHVAIAAQRREKLSLARRALGPGAWTFGPGLPTRRWRRRMRAHLRAHRSGRLRVGFLARGSAELVGVTACPVLVRPLERLLPAACEWLQGAVTRAEVVAVASGEEVVAAIHARPLSGSRCPEVDEQTLVRLGVTGLMLHFGRARRSAGVREVVLAESRGEHPITCDASGFCQAGAGANAAIRTALGELLATAPRASVAVEFYAGSGNLSATLLRHADRVIAVERDRRAVGRARRSFAAELADGRLRLEVGDAAGAARELPPAELWVLDPGRPGAPELMTIAARRRPGRLLYVSCAFDTMARDLDTLRAAGYDLVDAALVDTFPHTPHFELLALLRHRGRSPRSTDLELAGM